MAAGCLAHCRSKTGRSPTPKGASHGMTSRVAKTIGILTGGGDRPGLNAVIRAVVRSSDAQGWDCVAVLEGWRRLVEGRLGELGPEEVSGLRPGGGAIIGPSRTNPFKLDGAVEKVLQNFRDREL